MPWSAVAVALLVLCGLALRLLALRSLESQVEPRYLDGLRRSFNPISAVPAAPADCMATRADSSCHREGRHGAEDWPSYTLHMSQAHFFESLGLLAQAEQEWRLALDSKPNGKPADLGTRCSVWHSLGGVMRRRACERYGVPYL